MSILTLIKHKMKTIEKLLFAIACLTTMTVQAQVVVKTEKGDLGLRLIGRTNLDYGRYLDNEQDYGVRMSDTRLGIQATFDTVWSAKAEICYDKKAISFRDLWIGYQINESMYLKGGNHFQPFGAKILGLAYKFVQDAPADYAICPSRKVGVSYGFISKPFLGTAGLYSDGNVDAFEMNDGFSVSAKAIVRPVLTDNTVLHIGAAGMYTKSNNGSTYKGVMPNSLDTKSLILSDSCSNKYKATDIINVNRMEIEAIFIYKKLYAEGHYLQAYNNLIGDNNFKAEGYYAQASYLILGNQQNYNKKTGLAQNASPKNLEILARFDHLELDNEEKMNDVTIGANYFFNKNLNARLNYIYAKSEVEDKDYTNNMIQARLQFSF